MNDAVMCPDCRDEFEPDEWRDEEATVVGDVVVCALCAKARRSRRSENPAAAIARVAEIMFGPVPDEGSRHDMLADLAFRAAEGGQTNDWILIALNTACDLWGKYPRTFERWTKLLNLLRMARTAYPNAPDGQGWRP